MNKGGKRIATAVPYHPGKDRFLLLKRSEEREVYPCYWDFPSGSIEDESSRRAALRELHEETGLNGEIFRTGDPFEVDTEYGNFMIYPFLVRVDSDEVSISREHLEFEWVRPEDLSEFETVDGLKKDLESVGVVKDE